MATKPASKAIKKAPQSAAAKRAMVTLRLLLPHTHRGRRLPPGARLVLPPDRAQWLINLGGAKIEGEGDRDSVDPGVECWGLRLVASEAINDVLLELELATHHAYDFKRAFQRNSVQWRFAEQAVRHCGDAWKIVEGAELACRRAVGNRPQYTGLNPSREITLLQDRARTGPLLWNFSHIRLRVGRAQNALNAALYEEMRPGRKRGTHSVARPVLLGIVRALPRERRSINSVIQALRRLANTTEQITSTPQIKVTRVGAITAEDKFKFDDGRRSVTHGRRAIQEMLPAIKKLADSEQSSLWQDVSDFS